MHNTSENRRFRTVSLPIMTVYRFFEKISSFHDLDFKQGVEKRPSRFSLIGDAKKSCAGNFALCARCKLRGELRASRSLQVAHCSEFIFEVWSGKTGKPFFSHRRREKILRTARIFSLLPKRRCLSKIGVL